MRDYPYPELQKLLQLHTQSETYYDASERRVPSHETGGNKYNGVYNRMLPIYKFAECPISGTGCFEPIDTYNIFEITVKNQFNHSNWYSLDHLIDPPSPYLIGTHMFENLHGHIPKRDMGIPSEVPYLSTQFIPDELESYAVLHALPVCERFGTKFIATYTAFMLTYFARDPRAVIKKYKSGWWEGMKEDDGESYQGIIGLPPRYFEPKGEFAKAYDLPYWANRGKLGYLDFTKPELPLVIGEGTVLPEIYRDIPGKKTLFFIKDGHIRPGKFETMFVRGINPVFQALLSGLDMLFPQKDTDR